MNLLTAGIGGLTLTLAACPLAACPLAVAQDAKQPGPKPIKVLWIESGPRYEYRFARNSLERAGSGPKARLVDLKVLLLGADPEIAKQDPAALAAFPAGADELNAYDAVILGDVDPGTLKEKNLKLLADFVQEKGGGLLMIAGRHFAPHAYRETALARVLPVDLDAKPPKGDDKDRNSFHFDFTAAGQKHSLFRFSSDANENQRILKGLPAMYWSAEGYWPRAKAEVLALHPTIKVPGKEEHLASIVAQSVGKGRSLFFGVDEFWRWRYRENETRHEQFWLQVVRSLAPKPAPEKAESLITPATETAINDGLAFLAKHQAADGSWGTNPFKGNVAITSLAGLAFLAGGHHPGCGAYRDVVGKAADFVLDHEDRNLPGFLNNPNASAHGPMYSHGAATLFLAEVHGTLANPKARKRVGETLARAVRLLVNSQNHEGGWRYQPRVMDADISVTVFQLAALRAARDAGIAVPKATIDKAVQYIKACQDIKGSGGFSYQARGGTMPGFARSAAGLYALQRVGLKHTEEARKALAYVKRFPPAEGRARTPEVLVHYYYGHYYATHALWTVGGKEWNDWYPAIRDDLLRPDGDRKKAGNWHDGRFCTHYCTAMALLILQAPNNYLPMSR